MMVLDKWLGNADGRQAIFLRKRRSRFFRVMFIDHGYCFNSGEWTFEDLPLHGVHHLNYVYKGVTGWESFEPTLTKAENVGFLDLWRSAQRIPTEWYGNDSDGLRQLVEIVYERRLRIRELIEAFRTSERNPFPNWKDGLAVRIEPNEVELDMLCDSVEMNVAPSTSRSSAAVGNRPKATEEPGRLFSALKILTIREAIGKSGRPQR